MSTKIKNGDKVKVHFIGTLEDGEEFDNSYDRGEPISCTVGSGEVIVGFDNALVGMAEGETKRASLDPENGYGERNEKAVTSVEKSLFGEEFQFKEGGTVYGKNENGQELMARIAEIYEDTVLLDFNHPMAGMNLNFDITVVEIESE